MHVPILLDREVPKNPNNGGKDPTSGPKRSAKREVGEKEEEETAPVPDAEPEGIRAAVGARAKALDPPLRQPRDRFHLRIVRVSHSGAHRSLARREVNQTKQQRRFAPVIRKGSSISFDTFGSKRHDTYTGSSIGVPCHAETGTRSRATVELVGPPVEGTLMPQLPNKKSCLVLRQKHQIGEEGFPMGFFDAGEDEEVSRCRNEYASRLIGKAVDPQIKLI